MNRLSGKNDGYALVLRKVQKLIIPFAFAVMVVTAGSAHCAGNWSPITSDNLAPPAATGAREVWTGSEMVVWGGMTIVGGGRLDTTNLGSRYNPATQTWVPMSTDSAPSARISHGMVWTGSKVVVWGGSQGESATTAMNTGGVYDPNTNTWTAMSLTGAPSARNAHCMIWTGRHVVVWGGQNARRDSLNDGAKYDPVTDSWSEINTVGALSARHEAVSVWTGSKIIIWGGRTDILPIGIVNTFSDGGIYDPETNLWSSMTSINAPSSAWRAKAVWSGSEMIVFGGYPQDVIHAGQYNPTTDTWTALGNTSLPGSRADHTAVWTGTEMLIWGGWNGSHLATGASYNPTTKIWTQLPTSTGPSARSTHTAVWTGLEMLVWGGGTSYENVYRDGSQYQIDSDGDSIPDRYETGTGVYVSATNTGTSPSQSDTDGDGLSDGQEVNVYASNPNLKDTDGDGFEDGFEVSTGFSPISAASTPEASSSIMTAVEFRFIAANDRSYRIESSPDLSNWNTIEASIPGTGGVITRFYSIQGQTAKFYRARKN